MPNKPTKNTRWTTQNELSFIRRMGRHSICAAVRMISTTELLNRYVAAAELRAVWDGLNKAACINAALARISELKGL